MTKSASEQTSKTRATPNNLSRLGRGLGIELTESQLGQASGGNTGKKPVKSPPHLF